MAMEITGMGEFFRLLDDLEAFAAGGSRQSVDLAAKDIATDLREGMAAGSGADGSPMAPLKQSTLEGPVRRSDDSRKRSDFGSVPLYATGKTAASIKATKTGSDSWEIGSDSALGDAILASNAKTTHGGIPFAGDTPKAVRDPIQVTDKQMDTVENALLKALEGIING